MEIQLGQQVWVKVIKVNAEKGHINLSMKDVDQTTGRELSSGSQQAYSRPEIHPLQHNGRRGNSGPNPCGTNETRASEYLPDRKDIREILSRCELSKSDLDDASMPRDLMVYLHHNNRLALEQIAQHGDVLVKVVCGQNEIGVNVYKIGRVIGLISLPAYVANNTSLSWGVRVDIPRDGERGFKLSHISSKPFTADEIAEWLEALGPQGLQPEKIRASARLIRNAIES